jgi:hypothetical protein
MERMGIGCKYRSCVLVVFHARCVHIYRQRTSHHLVLSPELPHDARRSSVCGRYCAGELRDLEEKRSSMRLLFVVKVKMCSKERSAVQHNKHTHTQN